MSTLQHRFLTKVVIDRADESLDAVAHHTSAFVQNMNERFNALTWRFIDAATQWQPWTTDLNVIKETIMERMEEAAKSDPYAQKSYSLPVASKIGATTVVVGLIGVGVPFVGTQMPAQYITTRLSASAPHRVETALLEPVLESLVDAWQPVFGQAVEANLNRAAITQGVPHGGWSYPIGYRVWLRDDVATGLDYLAEGLTRRDFAGGVLIAAPDAWSPEQIVAAFHETYTRNGLVEVPHPVP